MGQAKSRGNQEQRIAEAKKQERAKFPASVACNHCQAQLTEIEPMDVRKIPNIWLAGFAICRGCKSTTWILDGTHDGLVSLGSALKEGYGEMSVGMVDRP